MTKLQELLILIPLMVLHTFCMIWLILIPAYKNAPPKEKSPKTNISKLYLGEGIIRYTLQHKDHWYSRWHYMMDGDYPRLFSKDELELLGYKVK